MKLVRECFEVYMVVGLCMSLILSGCSGGDGGSGGGNEAGSAPVSTPTAPTPSVSPQVIFNFDPGVSSSDESVIRDGVAIAQHYFSSQFGWSIPTNIAVNVTSGSGPVPAQCCATGIEIRTGHPVWMSTSLDRRRKIVVHEFFHILQSQIGWNGAVWLSEGSAEYVGFQAVYVDRGLASADQIRGCHQFSVDTNSAPLPALSELEGATFSRVQGTPYSLAYLAAEQAIFTSGIQRFRNFGELTNSRDWHDAFQSAFLISVNAFYEMFEAYRRSWQRPRNFTCDQ